MDYKGMSKTVEAAYKIEWPSGDVQENFLFTTSTDAGDFQLKFKWLNDRWNLWVTLPDGTVRQAGCVPNVTSWTGFLDYGVLISSDLETIGFDDLFMTELYILEWA